MAEATGIRDELENGRAGSLIKGLDLIEETLGKDLKLELPNIVVIGDESSGKSTLMERIAMLEFFPKNEGICTRMPIKLCLKHLSPNDLDSFAKEHSIPKVSLNDAWVRMKYEETNGKIITSEKFYAINEVQQAVDMYMHQAVEIKNKGMSSHVVANESGYAGVIEDELTIEVFSNRVPNLTLIDLPGIVTGTKKGEPASLPEDTRRITEKYIKRPHTLILAVVSAQSRPRWSQAVQLIQKNGKEAQSIGVLTHSDKVYDTDKRARHPRHQLMDLLDGASADYVDIPNGYIAVKNRDTRYKEDLKSVVSEETRWFHENLPGYREKGKAGGDILIKKIVHLMCDYVTSKWVPAAQKQIQTLKAGINAERDKLGVDVFAGDQTQHLKNAIARTKELLMFDYDAYNQTTTPTFITTLMQLIHSEVTSIAIPANCANEVTNANNRKVVRNKRKELIPVLLDKIQKLILEVPDKALSQDSQLPMKLERFPEWRLAVVDAVQQSVRPILASAKLVMEKVLEIQDLTKLAPASDISAAFQIAVVDNLLVGPCLCPFWDLKITSKSATSYRGWFTEDKEHSLIRQRLAKHMQKLQVAESIVQSFAPTDGTSKSIFANEPTYNNNNNNSKQNENENKDCKVCFDKQIDCVLVPCGHQCVCQACSLKIRATCPICKQKVNQVVKTFSA